MARARNIKPGFFTNDELAEIDPIGRILFAGLWTIADRDGRLEDRPKKIKAEVLPYDECNCDELLQKLHDHKFIFRYSVDGVNYIKITNWSKHQNPHIKESPSVIPEPEQHRTSTVQEQEKNSTSPADSLNLIPDSGFLTTDSGYQDNSLVPAEAETKKTDRKYKFDPEHTELAERLKFRILDHKKNFKYPSSLDQWANTIRLMVEQDNRTLDEIATVVDWCQQDSFWQINILSADKLREKFDQLQLKMNSKSPPTNNASRLSMIESVRRKYANEG